MSNSTKVLLILFGILFVGVGGLWTYGNKKENFETSLTIDASPSFLFDTLADSQQYPDWMSQVLEITTINEEKEVLGSTFKVILEENGKSIGYQFEVIRFIENEMLSIRSSNATLSTTMVFKVADGAEDGKTKLVYRCSVANLGLGRVINFFINQQDRQSIIEEDLRALKKLTETDYQSIRDDSRMETSDTGAKPGDKKTNPSDNAESTGSKDENPQSNLN